ncbi:MAG: HD domain-containing protein [archaeon]
MNLPTEQQALDYFKQYKVPENIFQHCLNVRKVAVFLAKKVKEAGIDVNVELVDRLSLLHDLFKVVAIKSVEPNKFHKHDFSEEELAMRKELIEKYPDMYEGDVAYEIFKGGFPEFALALKNVSIPRNKNLTWEETLVHYADYRVFQNKIVSLAERLEYLKEMYPKPEGEWEVSQEHRLEIEHNIMQILNMNPEDLAKEVENGS